MTPEELDEATVKETKRRWLASPALRTHGTLAPFIAARLAREGWIPPEPEDPDLMAFREWASERWPVSRSRIEKGDADYQSEAQAFLAGARMAREQERERAKEVLDQAGAAFDRYALVVARCLKKVPDRFKGEWDAMMTVLHGYYDALAKYRREA